MLDQIVRRFRFIVVLVSLVFVSGCATTPLAPSTSACFPVDLDILTLSPTVETDSLRRVLHDNNPKIASDTLTMDRQRIATELDSAIKQALTRIGREPDRAINMAPVAHAKIDMIGQPIDKADLAALQAHYPADTYLRLVITDYGQTPRRWRGAYITFEVVTTLAIAGVLYAHRITRAAAGVYLVQESVEELSEGYAGFWAFNRLSRPVRIEADLIDGKSGQVQWHDSDTGMADWRWHNLRHMDDATRATLLTTSLHRAVAGIINDLADHYGRNCVKKSPNAGSAVAKISSLQGTRGHVLQ